MALHSVPRATAASGHGLRLHRAGDPGRGEVEAFIRGVYSRRFGAEVTEFSPVLVSLRDAEGHLAAAAGYRCAGDGPLFLEHYLRAPVEHVLAAHAARPPQRREIVEIGHLAAARAGAGRRLMPLLGAHLARQRFRWGVCTLTRELRQMMVRLGITPLALCVADPAALGEDAAHWGSYYAHEPLVLAGEVQPALRRLARRAEPEGAAS